jgi:hypothetical protein
MNTQIEITIGSEKQIAWARDIQMNPQGQSKAAWIKEAKTYIHKADCDEAIKGKAIEGIDAAASTAKFWIEDFSVSDLLSLAEAWVTSDEGSVKGSFAYGLYKEAKKSA